MFEHVGPPNHAVYLATAKRLLAPEGLFQLHTIGLDAPGGATDAWIDRYVFPNGRLPAASWTRLWLAPARFCAAQ